MTDWLETALAAFWGVAVMILLVGAVVRPRPTARALSRLPGPEQVAWLLVGAFLVGVLAAALLL